MKKNKIKIIRDKIDAIDHQLIELIQKRGSLAQKVGELKSLVTSNSSLYKPDREVEILRNVVKLSDGVIPDDKVKHIFKEIISAFLFLE